MIKIVRNFVLPIKIDNCYYYYILYSNNNNDW